MKLKKDSTAFFWKRREPLTQRHTVTSQKTGIVKYTALKTTKLAASAVFGL
jgi:hypothetical protein